MGKNIWSLNIDQVKKKKNKWKKRERFDSIFDILNVENYWLFGLLLLVVVVVPVVDKWTWRQKCHSWPIGEMWVRNSCHVFFHICLLDIVNGQTIFSKYRGKVDGWEKIDKNHHLIIGSSSLIFGLIMEFDLKSIKKNLKKILLWEIEKFWKIFFSFFSKFFSI